MREKKKRKIRKIILFKINGIENRDIKNIKK